MKQIRVVLSLLSLSGAALGVYACGGGGGGAASGPTDPLTSARAALTGMASGTQTTTTQSLTNALTLFQQAVKADPTSPVARFGEAVALAGVCTDLMDGGTTTVPPPSGGPGRRRNRQWIWRRCCHAAGLESCNYESAHTARRLLCGSQHSCAAYHRHGPSRPTERNHRPGARASEQHAGADLVSGSRPFQPVHPASGAGAGYRSASRIDAL